MGREIKRVPLDFKWPKDKVWEGYLNPHYEGHCTNCVHCEGRGDSPEGKALHDLWYGYIPFHPISNGSMPFTHETPEVRAFAERNCTRSSDFYGNKEEDIVREAKRLAEVFNRSWSHHLNQDDVDALWDAERIQHRGFKSRPKARELNLAYLHGIGHDSINSFICINARCKKYGFETTCAHCKGDGSVWDSPENKKLAEEWEKQEPPTGEGYQLWEHVSEGSPISPVFSTPEELANWLVTSPNYKWARNDQGTTYEQWLKFIRGPGWAPSFIGSSAGLQTGVQAVGS